MKNNISRRDLWYHVNTKLRGLVHRYHVSAVIAILLEEMLEDLRRGVPVRIANLGTISLEETKPRKYYHIHLRQTVWSNSHRIMKFLLTPKLRKKIIQFLDIDRTFKSG